MMNKIRNWLYIGKYRETLDENWLAAQGIGAVLQMAEAISYEKIESLYLPVDDGVSIDPVLLVTGLGFIRSNRLKNTATLVSCGAGISRSASFAIGALKEAENLTLTEALSRVKQHHPITMPHPELWKSLCEYFDEPVPVSEMMRVLFPGR